MYLVSIYFDENSNKEIQRYIDEVAAKSGNHYMIDGKVLPHVTVASFDTDNEENAVSVLYEVAKKMESGTITWVSVGLFLPYVIYLAPVLDEYLHGVSVSVHEKLKKIQVKDFGKYYQPFSWMPHTTIGKRLSDEELTIACGILQKQFRPFQGQITSIGLAKTNPYRDIVRYTLK